MQLNIPYCEDFEALGASGMRQIICKQTIYIRMFVALRKSGLSINPYKALLGSNSFRSTLTNKHSHPLKRFSPRDSGGWSYVCVFTASRIGLAIRRHQGKFSVASSTVSHAMKDTDYIMSKKMLVFICRLHIYHQFEIAWQSTNHDV